jgi:hypothetical protein
MDVCAEEGFEVAGGPSTSGAPVRMTRGEGLLSGRVALGWAAWGRLLGEDCRSLPLVGMTRGEGLLSGRVAARMGSVGPAARRRLQIPPVGRDDKGRVDTFRNDRDLDGQRGTGLSATTVDPSTALLRSSGQDDKGER